MDACIPKRREPPWDSLSLLLPQPPSTVFGKKNEIEKSVPSLPTYDVQPRSVLGAGSQPASIGNTSIANTIGWNIFICCCRWAWVSLARQHCNEGLHMNSSVDSVRRGYQWIQPNVRFDAPWQKVFLRGRRNGNTVRKNARNHIGRYVLCLNLPVFENWAVQLRKPCHGMTAPTGAQLKDKLGCRRRFLLLVHNGHGCGQQMSQRE